MSRIPRDSGKPRTRVPRTQAAEKNHAPVHTELNDSAGTESRRTRIQEHAVPVTPPALLGFTTVLGSLDVAQILEDGLPLSCLEALLEESGLPRGPVLTALELNEGKLRLLQSETRAFSVTRSERLYRLAQLLIVSWKVRSVADSRELMMTPSSDLNRRSPASLILTAEGTLAAAAWMSAQPRKQPAIAPIPHDDEFSLRLDHPVRVMLTAVGESALLGGEIDLRSEVTALLSGEYGGPEPLSRWLPDGRLELPLWLLLQQFGPHLRPAAIPPIGTRLSFPTGS